MLFDLSIISASYIVMIVNNDTRSQFNDYSSGDDDREPSPTSIQIRYNCRELNILKAKAFSAYEFHKKISQGHRAKEYTREVIKAIQKINKVYAYKYNKKTFLSQLFTVAKKNNVSLKYKKNKSRRRALTGREAADQEDQALRRQIRADEIEKERREKFAEQQRVDQQRIDETRQPETISAFSQFVWPNKERESSSSTQQKNPKGDVRDDLNDFTEPFPNIDSDSDIEFLDTQPTQKLSQPPSKEDSSPPSPLISKPSLNKFINIDDFNDFPSLSPASLKKTALLPLMK